MQQRRDQQRQLNTLLENKNYSNGALRAKVRQSREFLSVATRELGTRKLATERLLDGIGEFECKLKRGLESLKMFKICEAKIDSFLMMTEHKVDSISRLKMERMQVGLEERQKYDQTEKKDRMLRLAIQDSHKRARKVSEEKVSLRNQMIEIDNDKMIARNTEQSAELQIQSAQDQIKGEMDRVASLKRNLLCEIEDTTTRKDVISSEIDQGDTSLKALNSDVQVSRKKIIEFMMAEGHVVTPQVENVSPVFDQRLFRQDLARLEEELKKDEDEFLNLRKEIKDTELAGEESHTKSIRNKKEASILVNSAKSLTEKEQKIRNDAVDSQVALENVRAEVAKLQESFQEMVEIRESEARTIKKASYDCKVQTMEQLKIIENLKLKIKAEDTSLRTNRRNFEEAEKCSLMTTLEQAKKKTVSVEKKFQDLVDASSEDSILSKLRADFENIIENETIKWDTQNKNLVSKCNEYFKGEFHFILLS